MITANMTYTARTAIALVIRNSALFFGRDLNNRGLFHLLTDIDSEFHYLKKKVNKKPTVPFSHFLPASLYPARKKLIEIKIITGIVRITVF